MLRLCMPKDNLVLLVVDVVHAKYLGLYTDAVKTLLKSDDCMVHTKSTAGMDAVNQLQASL